MIYSNTGCDKIVIDDVVYNKKEGMEIKMHYKELIQTAMQYTKNVQVLFDSTLYGGEPRGVFSIFLCDGETYEI